MRIEKIGDITFILGDCMEFLKDQKENSFDLAIVDPPYGINIKQRVYKDDKKWDNNIPPKQYFDKLIDISKNSIIWGANYYMSYLKSTNCVLTWDKKITDKHDQSQFELAWTSFSTRCKTFYSPPPGHRGFYKIDGVRIHPTQKPIQLYKWLLSRYAKEGDKILDTHGGSGSIAIACYQLGFNLTIIEKDEDYFNSMLKRFKLETAQKQLF